MCADMSPRRVWQIAAGDRMRPYWKTFFEHNVALIGPGWPGRWTPESPDVDFEGSYVRRFATEPAVGDIIVLRKGRQEVIGVGLIASDYSFEETFDDVTGWDLEHARRVRWRQVEHSFERPVFGANPARFGQVRNDEVIEYSRRVISESPVAWQTAELLGLPQAAC